MIVFVEECCSYQKRYAKSPCNIHSSNEKKSNICNIDCNLYGSMMLFPLPIGDYKFLKSSTIKKIQNILKKKKIIKLQKHKHMFLEVDLNYPSKLHKLHSNFPLAPEKFHVRYEHLSPFCKKLHSISNMKKYYHKLFRGQTNPSFLQKEKIYLATKKSNILFK